MLRRLGLTYLALLVLLALTVWSTGFDLGWGNTALNLAIAFAKATLIGLVFMQLIRASPLVTVAVGVLALWLSILFVLPLVDYLTR